MHCPYPLGASFSIILNLMSYYAAAAITKLKLKPSRGNYIPKTQ